MVIQRTPLKPTVRLNQSSEKFLWLCFSLLCIEFHAELKFKLIIIIFSAWTWCRTPPTNQIETKNPYKKQKT